MKYNKRELMAIEALNTLSTNLLSGRKTTLRSAEITAMHEVLGIVFHCSTAKAAKQKNICKK